MSESASMDHKIYVIIVTYNAMRWIEKCVNSVLDSSSKATLVIVDNNSSDATVETIKNKYPQAILVENKENLGFGKANNIGLKIALEKGGNYFLLLNQDAYLKEDTLQKLMLQMETHKGYGILSPIHLDGQGNQIDLYFQTYINPSNCKNLYSDVYLNKKMKSVYDVRFVNAAIWLLSKKTLQEVGGFNPYFFHYAEDNDYVNRCKFKSLKVGVVPDAFAYHDREQQVRNSNPRNLANLQDLKLMNPNSNLSANKMIRLTFKKTIKALVNWNKSDFLDSIRYLKKLYSTKKQVAKIKNEIKNNPYPFLN
ncbi:GT2 family glycosyltransferase [Flavobacterium endophyticum]|uniref:GT2 family glycosyltransferase n=1 Tax=Flavobacterium endophyticum TaxID=1540163 RepID=A0A495M955_9FLAO|nr:glycosyltransferase family 2 protein [Flavobacterium endophyticum]RKS21825.1 GT2 family glycosyltransferase [Flavobacterium endophyticum]